MNASLESLIAYPGRPPFIYVHHPHHPPSLVDFPVATTSTAVLDAIEYHTPRLLFSGILHKLGSDTEEVTTWDLFARGLREVYAKSSRKGKGRAVENGLDDEDEATRGLVIVITHAERLRFVLGSGWSVLTRLSELTGVPSTIILASGVPWDEVRPPRADAPDPLHVFLPAPTREEILQALLPASSHPLWPRFLDLLLSSLLHLTPCPIIELEYVAEALWPIYTSSLSPHLEQTELGIPLPDPSNPPPPLVPSIKLLTDLKHSLAVPLAVAAEDLLTRNVGTRELTEAMLRKGVPGTPSKALPKPPGLNSQLSLCGKYLIVAGYCASYNPAKSDLRLFGRIGTDGKKRQGGTRRAGYGRTRVGKVPQRLLGPKPFTLDRLLALFASLYAEHATRPEDLLPSLDDGYTSSDPGTDGEDPWRSTAEVAQRRADRIRQKELERDERWEEQVQHLTMSVKLWSLIPELEAQGLLKRTSPIDRLDNITMRCEVDYEQVKSLAQDLRLTLDDYLYEATA